MDFVKIKPDEEFH
jgi:hypothetical protein